MTNKLTRKPEQSKNGDAATYHQTKEESGFVLIPKFLVDLLDKFAPSRFIVYIAVKSFRNNQTGQCNPSVPKISERSGLVQDTVRLALNDLESVGGIVRRKTSGTSNQYEFPKDAPGESTQTAPIKAKPKPAATVKKVRTEAPKQNTEEQNTEIHLKDENPLKPNERIVGERGREYLAKKQRERPELDMNYVRGKFLGFIQEGKFGYRNTVRCFDKFWANEEEPAGLDESDFEMTTAPQVTIADCSECDSIGMITVIVDGVHRSAKCRHNKLKEELAQRAHTDVEPTQQEAYRKFIMTGES